MEQGGPELASSGHGDKDEQWQSACVASDCVQVLFGQGQVWVRSSRAPDLSVGFTVQEWTDFLAGVEEGKFGFPGSS